MTERETPSVDGLVIGILGGTGDQGRGLARRFALAGHPVIIGSRTDARAPLGLDAAIERANRYARVGADVIFVEAPQDAAEIERIARDVDAPLLINLVLGGMTPLESAARLQQLGYAIAIHPGNLLTSATFGMLQSLCELNGTDIAPHLPAGPADFFNLVGMAEWLQLDTKYARKDPSWA